MKILITGGTGFVGGHLVRELLGRGHTLRLLVHRRAPTADPSIEQVEGDVASPGGLHGAAEGCDAVINLVGIIRELPGRGVTFRRLHVEATASVLGEARRAGVRRCLQMSALGTRPAAVSAYHRTKWEAEELVRGSGLSWTIFRPSLIFGPKDAFVNMLADQLRLAPVMPVIGSGAYRLQPIHADDVARCFALALEMPETVGQTYGLCGDRPMSYLELLDTIAAAMGKRVPFKPRAPLCLMRLVIPILQSIPQFPITMDQLQMLLEESVCDGSWKSTFGFEPRSFTEGITKYLSGGGSALS